MGSVREALRSVSALFSSRPQPHRDAQDLVCHVLKLTRTMLLLDIDAPISQELEETLIKSARKISSGKPLEYEIGHCMFLGMKINVNPFVLIPRPDTELLVMEALKIAKSNDRILDLCTGSGCIALAIKARNPFSGILASDNSLNALGMARKNAQANNLEIEFARSDLFESINGRFDIIVSNPPYIPTSRMQELEKEISYEPKEALDGGADGLDFYRRIARDLPDHLKPGGTALFEIDCPSDGEKALLLAVFKHFATTIINDLSGRPRVLTVRMT